MDWCAMIDPMTDYRIFKYPHFTNKQIRKGFIMTTKHVLVSTALVFVFALTVFGQTTHKAKTKAVIKENEFSRVMGKPTYESKVDSLDTRIWVMTQAQHKRMMKGTMGLMLRREMESLHKHPMMGRMSDSSMGKINTAAALTTAAASCWK